MKKWFLSLQSTVTLSLIAILVFLGRAFIDFYYVYGEFNLDVGMVTLATLANMILFGGWIWSLLAVVQGSRRGLIAAFCFNLFFLVIIAIGTLVSYCPSPCRTGWPLGEVFIWLSLVFGVLATLSSGIQLQGSRSQTQLGATL